jgi:hypothetical protein
MRWGSANLTWRTYSCVVLLRAASRLVSTPALDQGYSRGPPPAFTGLASMYIRIFWNSLGFRTQ